MPEIHKTINFEGKTIHYRDEGSQNKKTIVLLHGLLQDLTVWGSMTLKLMQDFRVISIDLPGHGYSDCYNNDVHSMEFMARCVNEVLISCGVSDCVIVGHSLGGYVALAYAENYPYNIKGIGLLHAHALADDAEQVAARQKVCEEVLQSRPSYILQFVPSLFSYNSRLILSQSIEELKKRCLEVTERSIIAAQNGMARRKSTMTFLSQTNLPVMFIYGKEDTRIPLELAAVQATIPRHSEALFLDGVGHMAHLESPKTVQKWLHDFVETCYM